MSRRLAYGVVEALPFIVMAAMVFMAPHVKVEESFNAQLMHDLIFDGGRMQPSGVISTDVDRSAFADDEAALLVGFRSDELQKSGLGSYDHHSFPGVVPRTTIGAFAVATIAAPIARLYDAVAAPESRVHALIVCRLVLGAASCASLVRLARALSRKQTAVFNGKRRNPKSTGSSETPAAGAATSATPLFEDAGVWLLLLVTFASFHTVYYASRPLPNTFAFVLVNMAVANILDGAPAAAIVWFAAAAAIFRSDVAVLAAPVCLLLAAARAIGVVRGAVIGVLAIVGFVALSVAIDSLLWGHATWPEGVVFYFNTVMNKSGAWGRMPWHWYFSSALPRAMLVGLPLSLAAVFVAGPLLNKSWTVGRVAPDVWRLGACVLVFVALYSTLPHKELRFVLVGLPTLTASGAVLASRLWTLASTSKKAVARLAGWGVRLGLLATLVGCACLGFIMLECNKAEYVGAEALRVAHADIAARHESASSSSSSKKWSAVVYLDAYACMNGVTRFEKLVGERGRRQPVLVKYTKDPNLLNRTALEEAGKFPTELLTKLDYLIIRSEDVEWFVEGARAQGVPVVTVADVPKLNPAPQLPKSPRAIIDVLRLRQPLVLRRPTPFLTVLRVDGAVTEPTSAGI